MRNDAERGAAAGLLIKTDACPVGVEIKAFGGSVRLDAGDGYGVGVDLYRFETAGSPVVGAECVVDQSNVEPEKPGNGPCAKRKKSDAYGEADYSDGGHQNQKTGRAE